MYGLVSNENQLYLKASTECENIHLSFRLAELRGPRAHREESLTVVGVWLVLGAFFKSQL